VFRPHLLIVFALALCVATLSPSAAKGQDASDPVKRTRLGDQLLVSLDARQGEDGAPTYVFRYRTTPGDTRKPLVSGKVFTASDAVQVTYPRFNPFNVQVTAAVTAAPDPGFTAVTRLVEALLATAGVLRPDLDLENVMQEAKADLAMDAARSTTRSCTAQVEAQRYLTALTNRLYDPRLKAEALLASVKEWSQAIDKTPGPVGIRSVQREVKNLVTVADDDLDTAKSLVKELDDRLKKAAEAVKAAPGVACAADTLTIYQLIQHSRPAARLLELGAVRTSIQVVAKGLEPLGHDGAWVEDDHGRLTHYVVTTVEPTVTELQVVEIKGSLVTYDAGLAGLAVSTKTGATAKFTIMRHAAWFPEIGAGVIFADFAEPEYGTGTDAAGRTIVKKVGQSSISLDPAVVTNFLLRQDGNVMPMVQVGAVPAPASPGFVVGIGFRFVRPRIGFAVGWAHLWIEDLTGLEENDPVTGTEQITSSLKRQGRDKPYFMIQYTF
jgi:hypothetical protein